jgi:biotin carboxyl carrier protein
VTANRSAAGWRLSGDLEADIPFDGPASRANGVVAAPPPSATASGISASHGSGSVTAPMPGKIVSVAVQAGGSVNVHDLLVVLEAMKMEHRIEAPVAGVVSALHVAPGDLVAAGAPLVTIGAA